MKKCDRWISRGTLEEANEEAEDVLTLLKTSEGISIPTAYVADLVEVIRDNYLYIINQTAYGNREASRNSVSNLRRGK